MPSLGLGGVTEAVDDVIVIGLEAPQRLGYVAQDPVAAGIPEDFPVVPLEPRFSGDDDTRAQLALGNGTADDFFGAAKSIRRCRVDQGDAAFDGSHRRAIRADAGGLPRRLGLGTGRLYGQWPLAAGALRGP
jgi:hypothetical protein